MREVIAIVDRKGESDFPGAIDRIFSHELLETEDYKEKMRKMNKCRGI